MPNPQNNTLRIQYLPPRLTQGDDWYVSYSILSPYTDKMVRKKIRLNKIKSITQRKLIAKNLISEIESKLAKGWNPLIDMSAPKNFHTTFKIFDTYMNIMNKEAEAHSLRSYKSYIKFIKNWLLKRGYGERMYIGQFTDALASDMMLEIKQDENKSFRTYNNYLQFYTTLFNWMIQFSYVKTNPFIHLKKIPKRKITKSRKTLSPSDRKSLQTYLIKEENYNYLAMCYLCYFCCIRPNEISLLQIKDVNLEKQLVYISESVSKNDHASYRTIPDVAMWVFKKLDYNYPSSYYLFSMDKKNKFIPGTKRAEGREIARYWGEKVRPALGWNNEIQFYSLKDTGITNLLADGIAPNFVQGQADHSSLAVTSIYAEKYNSEAHRQLKDIPGAF